MKIWSKCPKKLEARLQTIIDQYRKHFSYCVSGQYWSMAGRCDGPGCEYDQIVSEGLVRPDQFHGVDHAPEVIKGNREDYPETNWHYDDFYWAMVKAQAAGDFRPSIVNADLIQTVDTGADYIGKIMAIASSAQLLVANFIVGIRGRYKQRGSDYVMDKLLGVPSFRAAFRGGWEYGGECYVYPGTGKSRTTMASFVFVQTRLAVAA